MLAWNKNLDDPAVDGGAPPPPAESVCLSCTSCLTTRQRTNPLPSSSAEAAAVDWCAGIKVPSSLSTAPIPRRYSLVASSVLVWALPLTNTPLLQQRQQQSIG